MLTVAAIQMRSGADPAVNMAAAEALIREAAAGGATLIATPEMTGLLQRKPKLFWDVVKTEDEDPLIPAFAALAKELGITLLIGSLAVKVGQGRAANRSYLFGPDGKTLARYDKMHMFDVTVSRTETWRESAIYEAGTSPHIVETPAAKLGLSICYDLRFAELYRHYGRQGAQIITVPAAFTVPTGQAHWEVLLRARAIETGAFIIAPAQGGAHEDGRTTYGHAIIIDPWGAVVAQLGDDEPGVLMAKIDLSEVDAARAKIPAWSLEPKPALA